MSRARLAAPSALVLFFFLILAPAVARSTPEARRPIRTGLVCLERQTGKVLWESFPLEIQGSEGHLRLCTDGKSLRAGDGQAVAALDLGTGEPANPARSAAVPPGWTCNEEKAEPEKLPDGMTVVQAKGRGGFTLLDSAGYVIHYQETGSRWPSKLFAWQGRVLTLYLDSLSSFDPYDRKILWTYPTKVEGSDEGNEGLAFSDLLPGPGLLYAVQRDKLGEHRSTVVGIDPEEGWPTWRTTLPAPSFGGGKLSLAGGALLARTWGGVFALDSRTGAVLWRLPSLGSAPFDSPLASGERLVLRVRGPELGFLMEALSDESLAVFAGEAIREYGGGGFLPVLRDMARSGPRRDRPDFERLVESYPRTSSFERLFSFLISGFGGSPPKRKALILGTLGAETSLRLAIRTGAAGAPSEAWKGADLPGRLPCGDETGLGETASRLNRRLTELNPDEFGSLPSLGRATSVILAGLCDPVREVRYPAAAYFTLSPDPPFMREILLGLLDGATEEETVDISIRIVAGWGSGGIADLRKLLAGSSHAKQREAVEKVIASHAELLEEAEVDERPPELPDVTKGPLSAEGLSAILALPRERRMPLLMEVVRRRDGQDPDILRGALGQLAEEGGEEAIPIFEGLLEDTRLVTEVKEPWFDLETGRIVERRRSNYWARNMAASFLEAHGRDVPDPPASPVRTEPLTLPSDPGTANTIGARLLDQFASAKLLGIEGAERIGEGAIGLLESAARSSDDRGSAELELGRAYSLMGDHSRAIDAYEKAAAERREGARRSSELNELLATEYAHMGDYEKALAALKASRPAESPFPVDPDLAAEVGIIQLQNGRPDQAAETTEWAVRQDPGEPLPWVTLAIARQAAGDARGAEASARSAEALGPRGSANQATYYYNLACYYALAGNTPKATQLFQMVPGVGFVPASYVDSDPDLDSLRGDPTFKAAVAKLRREEEKVRDYLR